MEKYAVTKFEAYEVNVNLDESLQEYALDFLRIFNTVKTQDSLIRVTNDYSNGVQVVCKAEALEATKDYLSNFGEITNVDKVLCVEFAEDVECNYDEYEDVVIVPYFE